MSKIELTPRAVWVKEKAIEFAKNSNHETVTLEHLLVAFLFCEDCKTVSLLKEEGVDIENIRGYLVNEFFETKPKIPKKTKQSREFLEVFSVAEDFASKCGEDCVTIDHVFIALLDLRDKMEPMVSEWLEVDNNSFQAKVAEYLGGKTFLQTEPEEQRLSFSFEALSKYAEFLNEKCRSKDFRVFNRDLEISKIEQILNRKQKNNVLLVGDSGVGKTAIVEYLAHKISNGDVGPFLTSRMIYSLNINSIVSGTKYRGEFEKKIEQIIKEVKGSSVILFIDEIHTIVGAGDSEGGLDISNILKPYLSNGEICVIGSTTFSEYRKKINKDKALDRRFDTVFIKEPSKEDTISILLNKKNVYEDYHFVHINEQIASKIVNLADKYINYSNFPDKAFDLLDLSCSLCKIRTVKKPKKLQKLEKNIIELSQLEDREGLEQLIVDYQSDVESWQQSLLTKKSKLSEEDVLNALSSKTNVPISRFNQDENAKYLSLSQKLKSKVFGQNEAIDDLCYSLYRSKMGFKEPNKPIGCYMFFGNTGLGKTLLAKELAEEFFDGTGNLIRLDMSEFSEKQSISRLVGASAGYIGYEEGGWLVEKVVQNPHSVILFDEIEKAHPDVVKVLLQINEEGELTDSLGRKAFFKNCIIIITGNVSSVQLSQERKLGFNNTVSSEEKRENATNELKKFLPPELIGRADKIIFFNDFSHQDMQSIIKNELNKFLSYSDVEVIYDNDILEYVESKNQKNQYGARQIKNLIKSEILDPLSVFCIKNSSKNVKMTINNKKVEFEAINV